MQSDLHSLQEQLEQQLTKLIQLRVSQQMSSAFTSTSSGVSKSKAIVFSEFVQKFSELQAQLQLGFRPEDLDLLTAIANECASGLSRTFSDDIARLNDLQALANSQNFVLKSNASELCPQLKQRLQFLRNLK